MQERRVRFFASGALFYVGLLLTAMGTTHAVEMRVKAFTAAFALRRAFVNCIAFRARLAVLPRLPFFGARVRLARQDASGCCHHLVKSAVAPYIAAEVRQQAVDRVRRNASTTAKTLRVVYG